MKKVLLITAGGALVASAIYYSTTIEEPQTNTSAQMIEVAGEKGANIEVNLLQNAF